MSPRNASLTKPPIMPASSTGVFSSGVKKLPATSPVAGLHRCSLGPSIPSSPGAPIAEIMTASGPTTTASSTRVNGVR